MSSSPKFFVGPLTGQPNGTITHVTTYAYDADGNPTSETDPTGNVARRVYLSDGLVKDAIEGGGNTTRYGYDENGNPAKVFSPAAVAKEAPNPSGTPTVNTFSLDNLLLTSTVPVAGDGSSLRRITYGYDPAGRKTSQRSDLANSAGLVTSSGRLQQFFYYLSDRLERETATDTLRVIAKTFTYDAAGNLTTIAETGGVGGETVPSTISGTYYLDDLVRTVDAGDGLGASLYSYDGSGRRAARADQSTLCVTCSKTTTRYTYSDAGFPASLTSDLISGMVSWSYDAAGRPKTHSLPNAQSLTYAFNPDDTLASVAVTSTGGTVTFSYASDKNYRITSQGYAGPGARGATPDRTTYGYAYDAAGRLSSFTDSTGARSLTWDRNGNRKTFGASRSFTYNADDSIKTEASGGQVFAYAYDPNGRLQTDGCRKYSYDPFDRMTNAKADAGCPSAETAIYGYDPLDRLNSRPDNPGFDKFDGLSDTITQDGNRSSYVLGPAGEPLALKNGTTTQFLSDDGQGNVSLIADASGALACTARFDPFGAPEAVTAPEKTCDTGSSPSNQIFYRGARRDPETGTYLFGSRIYDPAKASFLTADSYRAAGQENDLSVGVDPLTRNTYAYVNGDPVNLVDPDGHFAGLSRLFRRIGRRLAAAAEDRKRRIGECARELYINLGSSDPFCQSLLESPQAAPPKRGGIGGFFHGLLDVGGLVPVLGEVFDVANCAWYGAEGNALDAGLSCGAAIPILGYGATAAKGARTAVKAAGRADDLVDAVRVADKLGDLGQVARSVERAGDAGNAVRGARSAARTAPRSAGARGLQAPQTAARLADDVVGSQQVTVLGRYRGGTDAFVGKPSFNVLDLPSKGTGRWYWSRNRAFIDDAIARSDEIRLVTNPFEPLYSGGNVFQRELRYLKDLGYGFEQAGDYWRAVPGR